MKNYDLWPKTAFYRGGPLDPHPHVITYVAEPMWNRFKLQYKDLVNIDIVLGQGTKFLVRKS